MARSRPLETGGEVSTLNDITGRRFGRYVAQWPAGRRGRMIMWLCLCDCGQMRVVAGVQLSAGTSRSCGCLRDELRLKHGHAKDRPERTTEYSTWACMIQRCINPKNPEWKRYGAKGVKVCERWLNSFENFLADVGPRPEGRYRSGRPIYSIDRFPDKYGNYEPGNVRWATHKEQMNNLRPMTEEAKKNLKLAWKKRRAKET